ncbi:glycosyltransferase [Bacteroides fragilis]|jgi:glycosyltransferase involved in cell wall biosynthesis|uniref:glycosyltransferase family 2 protein n=1 Tax=Bacteroides fragilis TaxID=817 RepID=UPI001F363A84|nr:glycosyltransferase family 2 protein [Bacteroides fragilis]MCE8617790.1 glycosyltransferase [Bacteroides fragilis]MCZ2603509.1 glycosyltransferase family 2 protein [Bacteroides fragilis]UHZ86242.1 glycosyltransferase [Bacteroides fragilis]
MKRNLFSSSSESVTIITVSFNAVATIEKTILSVINQSYPVEYIIVDGGSNDGTLDIIRKYEEYIAYWVSEPDDGIYDAMNKGVRVAKGQWIGFMNSGDIFYSDDVISNILENDLSEYSIIYGKTLINYRWGKYIVTPAGLDLLGTRMPFCHQSTLVRCDILKSHPFDLKYKITADYNLFQSVYIKAPNVFFYFPDVISIYDAIYGISSINIEGVYQDISLPNRGNMCLSIVHKMKVFILTKFSYSIIDVLYKIYFFFNVRYVKVK